MKRPRDLRAGAKSPSRPSSSRRVSAFRRILSPQAQTTRGRRCTEKIYRFFIARFGRIFWAQTRPETAFPARMKGGNRAGIDCQKGAGML